MGFNSGFKGLMCGSERQKRDGMKTKSWNATILGKLVITQPVKKSQQSTLKKNELI